MEKTIETIKDFQKDKRVNRFPMKILTYPNVKLRIECEDAKESQKDKIQKLIERMFQTIDFYHGLGLAAPQIGVSLNVITVNVDGERHGMINPKIIDFSGSQTEKEGCLSFPGELAEVKRASKLTVSYKNTYWEDKILECEGLLSVCIQHELEHLEGVLFIDHLSRLKKKMIIKKMKKRKGL